MKYNQEITLKNGRAALLRNGVAADAAAVVENLCQAHAETDYLLSYPDECSLNAEKEAALLGEKTASANEIEIVAFVDGEVAGTAGIKAVGSKYKLRHRSEFGISILRGARPRPGADAGVHPVRAGGGLCAAGADGGGGERASRRAV